MLELKETIVVEGKYDLMKLREFISSPIITTEGFRVFADKEKQFLIREIAQKNGIILMTDPDRAGQVIRSFLNGIADKSKIKQCYVPLIKGVEKRKNAPSKEGLLGVEGLSGEVIADALRRCGAEIMGEEKPEKKQEITKMDLYELGLSGRENSAKIRESLLESLGLPTYLSANAMLCAINCLYKKHEIVDKLKELSYN
ncbi:MAG: DUF4093 domain-containing protein [Ruminococcaceae bacterium]|nr:DUF4093 domain-containing protein [Oscillospiraceae bacterium]